MIHSEFSEKENTPIQSAFANGSKGKVVIFPEYTAGLKDVDGFSHLILIYHFHFSRGYALVTTPFLDNEERGIFSIRHPRRPNPIGLSIVRLNSVRGNILEISDVDVVDGTPLLDIKPFVPQFDHRTNVKIGWYEHHI